MLNRKLLEILQRLTKAQRNRLREFLSSPYFSNGYNAGEIIRLFDLIVRYDAAPEHPALSYEAVFRQFFPERPFREKMKSPLDSLASDLFRLVKQFLGQTEMEREQAELYEWIAMARFYRKYALEERFWQVIQTARKTQEEGSLRDTTYYHNNFRIGEEELAFRGLYNTFEDDSNLNSVEKNIDTYYSIVKLEYASAFEYQKMTAQLEPLHSDELGNTILLLSDAGGSFDIPINRVYRKIISLLQNQESENALEELAQMLEQHKAEITPDKFNNLKTYYRVLWIKRYYQAGDEHSLRRIFEIYCEHLDQGYFYFDGLIPIHTFRNLVTFGLTLKKYDWVKQFLKNHPPERIGGTRYPAEIHSIQLADYHFALKQYEEALEHLRYRLFENPVFSILSDLLLIKIYFETQNELLETRIRALEQKVRRSKLSTGMKSHYLNFLQKLDKIIKYGWQTKSRKREQLIEEIKNTPEIVAREWLLEKLNR
jgi:hypothetical protein